MDENRTRILTAVVALILGLAVGLAAGYNWGFSKGKQVNTIQVGPDFKFQWKLPEPR